MEFLYSVVAVRAKREHADGNPHLGIRDAMIGELAAAVGAHALEHNGNRAFGHNLLEGHKRVRIHVVHVHFSALPCSRAIAPCLHTPPPCGVLQIKDKLLCSHHIPALNGCKVLVWISNVVYWAYEARC